MKKKPARQPRKIEVVEDVAVATKAAKAKAEPKAKKTKATRATAAPTDAPTDKTPTVVDLPAAQPEQNATVVKSGAKKGMTKDVAPATEPSSTTKRKTKTTEPDTPPQSERRPEQTVTVEGKLAGKLSAIDAAAKVLEGGSTLNCKELIEAMSTQGLWTSPGGKTPHATLYSAILREITTKGDESRFVKAERGDLRNDSQFFGSTRPGICWGVF